MTKDSPKSLHTVMGQEKGFTLLELLVAMLMVSMVTIIISVAFRLGLNAWDRSQREGDSFQARIVIPSILERQLNAIAREKTFVPGQGAIKLPFAGKENALSFFTTYTTMAGSKNGLLRVTYQYDEENRALLMYQQLVLTPRDLQADHWPLSDQWNGQFEPSGTIANVSRFFIRYAKEKSYIPSGSDMLETIWEETKQQGYPKSILLEFSIISDNRKGKDMIAPDPEVWHFIVGM